MTLPCHHYADLDDVRLHYVTAGEGPALVLLHGWPQTWYMWRDMMPALARHYRVIAPDLRGLGDSSIPESGYDTGTVSRDIKELVTGILGETCILVGAHDWGGPVAYALAAQNPELVRAMAILDVPVPGDGTPLAGMSRWHYGFHAEPDFPEALVEGREALYLNFFFDKGGATPASIPAEARAEYVRCYARPGSMRAGFNYYRALPESVALHERLRAGGLLDMPILVHGGGALSGRGLSALESWARVGTCVSGGVASGCGHWIAEEAPGTMSAQWLEFFANAPV